MSEGLFEMEPTPIDPGDRVRVQTIYGHELGLVEQVFLDAAGFPMATVRTKSGDKISLGIARVTKVERFGPTGVVCPTEGCTGDARYAAPGRGHESGCRYPTGGDDE